MPSTIASIEATARLRLIEPQPNFWSSAELVSICISGIKDLWRDTVDLKQEHYLTVDDKNVTLPANATTMSGVPTDVHKVYLIEPRDLTSNSVNVGLQFRPADYNHVVSQAARSTNPIDPTNATVYYSITGQGAPVNAPVIYTSPKVTSPVNITFSYVPTLGPLTAASIVPIPGEADNALVAWTVAFAMAKEKEDRSPDPAWISVYATEKAHLLQSLGLREYQEPSFVDAMWEQYW